MRRLKEIARWEFLRAAANKTFVIMTILGPFLMVAVTVLPSLVARGSADFRGQTLAVAGAGPEDLAAMSPVLGALGLGLEAWTGSLDSGRAEVERRGFVGLLRLDPDWVATGRGELYSKNGTDVAHRDLVRSALGAALAAARAREAGVDPALLGRLLAPAELETKASADGEGKGELVTIILTAVVFAMLIYVSTLVYGQLIGRSVVQEKSGRTVEILLSSARPFEILAGKILGIGGAALLQYGIWTGIGALALGVLGPALHVDLPAILNPGVLAWIVLFFVLAFFLYAGAFAALGAAAEDEQQLGQLMWPLIVFLVVPVSFVGALVVNPDSAFSLVLSLFPPTASIAMFLRILVSNPPAWQVALSILLLLAAIGGTALAAGRIFRAGILRVGAKGRFGDILRWLRAPARRA